MWFSSGNTDWILTGTAMHVNPLLSSNNFYHLTWKDINRNFYNNKTYQLETQVKNFNISSSFSSYIPSIGESFSYPSPGAYGYLYFYSKPQYTINTENYVTYRANSYFNNTNGAIYNSLINELDWNIQGFSWFRTSPSVTISSTYDAIGWHYDYINKIFLWYDNQTSTKYPVGGPYNGKTSNSSYRSNNYISKFVNYQFFNFSFYYQITGATDGYLKIYLSNFLWNDSTIDSQSTNSKLIATISSTVSMTQSIFAGFFGLQGNQYIYIVGPTSSSSVKIYLSNLKIEGGYHKGNNKLYLMTNSNIYDNSTYLYPIGLTGATFTAYSGYGNTINGTNSLTIYSINSMIGNGKFKSGIWENGVWNSGWRYDENLYEFFDIQNYIEFNKGKNWRFILYGNTSSVSNFNIGDKVSIGNIVAIDINENRKLIKNYFTIVGKNENSIIVELTNNFPLRRIEKDSENHRIYVTKNIWLSGVFLNGYFRGVWNYGLFKGFPKITEMYDSQWIDGIFDGGHFYARKRQLNFVDTIYTPPSGETGDPPKLGLTFSEPHGLNVGDLIIIDKNNKYLNPQYDGIATVISVPNEYQIVVDKEWGNDSINESGKIYTYISSGLIQNFIFDSKNISKITSLQSDDSTAIFVYNSWIDVNYETHSAVNIGKQQYQMDILTNKPYVENNLYGYITYDVLSSDSKFRDSYSLEYRNYKLGTKYKIYNDYIGNSSNFDEPLGYGNPTGSIPSIIIDDDLFIKQGWTYSKINGFTISRTVDAGIENIKGKELKIEAQYEGGVIDFHNIIESNILNRTNSEVEKFRYTMVEFDLITYSVSQSYFTELISNIKTPIIHFNNLNVKYKTTNFLSTTINYKTKISYLPVSENINHIITEYKGNKTKKYEYFYNKRNLSMFVRGNGLLGTNKTTIVIDNLKFYEIDMVPFFKYFNESNINNYVQVPYQGIAPFIDYSNSDFSFIDNISIGFNSSQVVQSFEPISGIGIGIGGGGFGGGGLPTE